MRHRTKRPRAKLHGLSNELSGILGEDTLEELTGLARLRRAWADIVGPMMATRTEPVQFEATEDGRCLWVGVDHSIMAQQIRFLRDEIRKACFKHAGIGKLTHIRTRMMPGAGIKPKKPKAKPKRLTFGKKRELALELVSIKDRGLRRAVFQARMAQLKYGDESPAQETEQNEYQAGQSHV